MLVGVIGSWWRRDAQGGRSVSVMPAWSIWVGAVVLLGVAAVSMWTLLALFGGGSPQDQIRLEIVKLAGGIVVGTGGAAALLLAARRQRALELQLAQNERDLAHKELVAADARHDAAERRITELYASAAEQLGSDTAPVRLAALHALERLAQDNPGHRQTVVDLLCAYLRMPFAGPGEVDPEQQDGHRQETQVRLTAQRLLTTHLRPGAEATFWADVDLDLTRATLLDWDMAGCCVRGASFDGAVFHGDASFHRAEFRGAVSFRGAVLVDAASFDAARFHDVARFGGTRCRGEISFRHAGFDGAVSFDGARFHGPASFAEGELRGETSFRHTAFDATASFREATFHDVAFGAAEFLDTASFDGTRFHGSTSFGGTRLPGRASFREAEFHDAVWFGRTERGVPDLSGARVLVPDQLPDHDLLRGVPGWRLTVDGATPDEDQRRWRRFEPATD